MEIKDMQGKTAKDLFDLEDRVAVVTGAGRGLGRAIARALGEFGASVVGTSRTESDLVAMTEEVEERGAVADYFVADVSDSESVEEFAQFTRDRFGPADILVNNAGAQILKSTVDYTDDEWQKMIDVNLSGSFYCARAFGPDMIDQGSGKIINVASISGLQGGSGVFLPYTATKGAQISFTKGLASEWAPHNVNVNCLVPGAFYTSMTEQAHQDPDIHNAYVKKIPLRRIGDPEEIGPLAVYLASEASDFVTGETFVIDGGMLMK